MQSDFIQFPVVAESTPQGAAKKPSKAKAKKVKKSRQDGLWIHRDCH